jgi:membrane protein DedA with SNARE-associated domain
VILFSLAGSFCKTTVIYFLGYFFGKSFLIKYSRWTRFRPEYLDFVKTRINTYGYKIIAPLQLVPVARRFVGAPCGILRLDFWRFMFWNMLGVTIWFVGLISLGYFLGSGYSKIAPQFKENMNIVGVLVGVVFAGLIVREVLRYLRGGNTDIIQ